jgi:hypothetical protein
MCIGYKLQLNTVLKKCLKTRKGHREALRRVGDVAEKLVGIARPARLRDGDERCIICVRRKCPLNEGATAVSIPFDEDSIVRLDDFCGNGCRYVIHLPFPFDGLSDFKSTTTLREPEFGGNFRIDKGVKDFCERLSDENRGLCYAKLRELEIIHRVLVRLTGRTRRRLTRKK